MSNPGRQLSLDPPAVMLVWDSIIFKPTSSPTDPVRIFGYYVTTPLVPFLLWAERLPRRVFFRDPTDSLVIVPTFGGFTEFTG